MATETSTQHMHQQGCRDFYRILMTFYNIYHNLFHTDDHSSFVLALETSLSALFMTRIPWQIGLV
jgi:hypothetical protein